MNLKVYRLCNSPNTKGSFIRVEEVPSWLLVDGTVNSNDLNLE